MHEQLTNQCLALAIASGVSLVAASAADTPKPAETAKPAEAAAPAAPAAAATAPVSETEKWIQDSKHPVPWLKWGADLRLRHEYIENAYARPGIGSSTIANQDAAGNVRSYERFRGRIYSTISPVKDFDLNTRVTVETREWEMTGGSSYTTPTGPDAVHSGFDWTEGIIDNLNFQWRNIAEQPLSLTVGRQDFMEAGKAMFGDGWLLMDGTPLDGSRTFYFDAARVKYDWKETKTVFQAAYIDQYAQNNAWLPAINSLDKYITEQHERGALFYATHELCPAATLDGYFIYKHDDYNAGPAGDDANIYTVGGRLSGDFAENWRYRAEGAYQFGQKDVRTGAGNPTGMKDIAAFGVNSQLSYLFKDKMNNQLRFSYEALSGDDAGTPGKNEGFDILWGRWPRWSEMYIYSFAGVESRIAQTANMHRLGPGWTFVPFKKAEFTADYYLLTAFERQTPNDCFGGGLDRGQMLQTIFRYKFNQHVSGHLWGEFVWPGNFYQHSDTMAFLRAEIMLTY